MVGDGRWSVVGGEGGFGGWPGSWIERGRWGWVLAMTSMLAMRSVHALLAVEATLAGMWFDRLTMRGGDEEP